MRIDSSGNLLVGTTVAGTLAASGRGLIKVSGSSDSAVGLEVGGTLYGYLYSAPSEFRIANITANPLTFYTNNTEQARITSTGLFQFNSGYGSVATAFGCRAWVNFDGTGTVSIRGSGNVSSITDNGTGSYTVNFINIMPDANYAAVGSTGPNILALFNPYVNSANTLVAPTTSNFTFLVRTPSTAPVDSAYNLIAVFR
jgi:hypothetical protein